MTNAAATTAPASFTHKIIGQAHIEGTQRGFVVWVKTDKRSKAQLTDANEDYTAAQATANSIDRGRWVGRRKGASLHVRGRTLTVERPALYR